MIWSWGNCQYTGSTPWKVACQVQKTQNKKGNYKFTKDKNYQFKTYNIEHFLLIVRKNKHVTTLLPAS